MMTLMMNNPDDAGADQDGSLRRKSTSTVLSAGPNRRRSPRRANHCGQPERHRPATLDDCWPTLDDIADLVASWDIVRTVFRPPSCHRALIQRVGPVLVSLADRDGFEGGSDSWDDVVVHDDDDDDNDQATSGAGGNDGEQGNAGASPSAVHDNNNNNNNRHGTVVDPVYAAALGVDEGADPDERAAAVGVVTQLIPRLGQGARMRLIHALRDLAPARHDDATVGMVYEIARTLGRQSLRHQHQQHQQQATSDTAPPGCADAISLLWDLMQDDSGSADLVATTARTRLVSALHWSIAHLRPLRPALFRRCIAALRSGDIEMQPAPDKAQNGGERVGTRNRPSVTQALRLLRGVLEFLPDRSAPPPPPPLPPPPPPATAVPQAPASTGVVQSAAAAVAAAAEGGRGSVL